MRELEEKHGWDFGRKKPPKHEKAEAQKPETKTEPAKKEK
jgi:hypothetical protein